ncbi:hypothetical protein HDV00_007754 [Rhizophlyctis rosea]|nr:hypothetical protein HDV00_007754 [Rhizophlyctis rosea]
MDSLTVEGDSETNAINVNDVFSATDDAIDQIATIANVPNSDTITAITTVEEPLMPEGLYVEAAEGAGVPVEGVGGAEWPLDVPGVADVGGLIVGGMVGGMGGGLIESALDGIPAGIMDRLGVAIDGGDMGGAVAEGVVVGEMVGDVDGEGLEEEDPVAAAPRLDSHLPDGRTITLTKNEEQPAALYALSDVHGDLEGTRSLLIAAGLVDVKGTWVGKRSVLVVVVEFLLGNHETMALADYDRYLNPDEAESFGGAAMRSAALARNGWLAKYLQERNVVFVHSHIMFVHGGIPAAAYPHMPLHINQVNKNKLRNLPRKLMKKDEMLLKEDSVLWYRGFALDPEDEVCPKVDAALSFARVSRFVIGHTPTRDGHIGLRCQGKVVMIDTGICMVAEVDKHGGHEIGEKETRRLW